MKKLLSWPLAAVTACLFAQTSALAAPTTQVQGASGVVPGGTATSVFTLQAGYDLLALDLYIDYDSSMLALSQADVQVDYAGTQFTLASFVDLLDGYNGSPFATAGVFSAPGSLSISFLSAFDALPSPASMTFTANFQVLANLLPGSVTTVSYSGTAVSDDPDPMYTGDAFAADAQVIALAAVPEPQSALLVLAGLAALAALRRRRCP